MSVLLPGSEEEAARFVVDARTRGAALRLEGGGTQAGLGRPTNASTVLSSRGLSGITLHEPAELVISAKAGTPLRDVEARLAETGQILPFEPVDLRALYDTVGEPTVGGLVAGNWSGPRRISAGAARDHLIGVRFVNGRGEVVKSGGRVMKNVTGLDLVKLQCGAHGTLGFLTEVTFKVLPKAEAATTLIYSGLDDSRGVALLTAALTSPFEVSGAAHLPATAVEALSGLARSVGTTPSPLGGEGGARSATDKGPSAEGVSAPYPSSAPSGPLLPLGEKGGPDLLASLHPGGAPLTLLRLENFRSSLDYRCGRLEALLAEFGRPRRLTGAESAALWVAIRDGHPVAEPRDRAVWRISVPPKHGPAVMARMRGGFAAVHYFDWGGGLIWLTTAAMDDACAAIRAAVSPCGGHATLLRASEAVRAVVPVFQPLAEPVMALTRRIKASFDPDLIFNPGRMYADA